eukprot:3303640-Rhodomonas_salina.3
MCSEGAASGPGDERRRALVERRIAVTFGVIKAQKYARYLRESPAVFAQHTTSHDDVCHDLKLEDFMMELDAVCNGRQLGALMPTISGCRECDAEAGLRGERSGRRRRRGLVWTVSPSSARAKGMFHSNRAIHLSSSCRDAVRRVSGCCIGCIAQAQRCECCVLLVKMVL